MVGLEGEGNLQFRDILSPMLVHEEMLLEEFRDQQLSFIREAEVGGVEH